MHNLLQIISNIFFCKITSENSSIGSKTTKTFLLRKEIISGPSVIKYWELKHFRKKDELGVIQVQRDEGIANPKGRSMKIYTEANGVQ